MKDQIYFPMSARIITPGHIKALEVLNKDWFVIVGLLTAKALKGYKEEIVPYEDRFYILETIAMALGNIEVVPQDSLDPSANIQKHKCVALASGDGFEPSELKAIKKLKIQAVNVTLPKEKTKLYSSNLIVTKCKKA